MSAHGAGQPAAKLGVFDSGVGGLSILRDIHRLLPHIPTLYVADQAHLPYGPRPAPELFAHSNAITHWLNTSGASVIVIACHSASAAALQALRAAYPHLTFVGIEPAIKPAVEQSRSGVVGVLTTIATADGALYRSVLERFARNVRVLTQISPGLVSLVENGDPNTPEGERVIRSYVEPLVEAGADHIVLACTHFPFIADHIQRIAGNEVTLVDPGPAVARQVARVWNDAGMLPEGSEVRAAEHHYFTTGDAAKFQRMAKQLIGVDASVESLSWSGDYDSERATAPALDA